MSPALVKLGLQFLAVIAVFAAILFGIHKLDQSRQKIGYDRAQAEYAVKLIAAQEDSKAQEKAWQAQQLKEREKTSELLNARDTAYAALARTTSGLRNAAVNYGNGLSTDTIASCRARAATLAELFGQCSDALGEMGRSAQGQYIDALSCRNQWPR